MHRLCENEHTHVKRNPRPPLSVRLSPVRPEKVFRADGVASFDHASVKTHLEQTDPSLADGQIVAEATLDYYCLES